MRDAARLLVSLALLFLPGAVSAAGTPRFDGSWQTTVSCAPEGDALGYAYRFISTVTNGVLHGLRGTAGQPGMLQIDGPIAADGTATLYATGRVNGMAFVPGRDVPRGSEFGYHIDAHFTQASGTGRRLEGRKCTLDFVRQ